MLNRKIIIKTCAATCLLIIFSHQVKSESQNLDLVKALPIEGSENLDLSGLTYCNGSIFLVSDKIDNTIYKLNISENSASLEPAITLDSIPEHSSTGHTLKTRIIIFLKSLLTDSLYDWEGIACDTDNSLLLLSETYIDIARVSQTGHVTWLNTGLLSAGKQQGLFQIDNAYVEGITTLSHNKLLVAAERQPRGLAKLLKKDDGWKIEIHFTETSPIPPKEGRSEDFSGLATHNPHFYSLERNASAVCARSIKNLKVVQCWSYAHVEESEHYRYQDITYGLGEGVIFTPRHLLVILDNNGDSRRKNPKDRRSQVFIFEKPFLSPLGSE